MQFNNIRQKAENIRQENRLWRRIDQLAEEISDQFKEVTGFGDIDMDWDRPLTEGELAYFHIDP